MTLNEGPYDFKWGSLWPLNEGPYDLKFKVI